MDWLRQNSAAVIIGAAIVLATIIYAFSTRYTYSPSTNRIFDRWTGSIQKAQ